MTQVPPQFFLKRLYNLPISQKTGIIPWLSFGAFTLIVAAGGIVLRQSLQAKLLETVKSQLAVTNIQYNIKIDQMGLGFRGQSDNNAVIEAANVYAQGKPLSSSLRSQVEAILKNEIKARNIEYATLVGKDKKIILNGNVNRAGELFDPNGLVSEVLRNPQQIQTSEIVSWQELTKESPPLPKGFKNSDALIRYTATPVKARGSNQIIGVLISGDIVNNKLAIVEKTVEAFAERGYSAVYFYDSNSGKYSLATSIKKEHEDGAEKNNNHTNQINIPLETQTLLEKAVTSTGKTVTAEGNIAKKSYALAAKAINNQAGNPVAVIVYGTAQQTIGGILWQSLLIQISLGLIVIVLLWLLTQVIGRAIALPIRELQQTTQEFSEGNIQARAVVNTADEVGLLASTFNVMADSIEINEERLRLDAQRSRYLKDLAFRIGQVLEPREMMNIAVADGRVALETDRVIYYCFDAQWKGTVQAESVKENYPQSLGTEIHDPCFAEKYIEKYQQGNIQATSNIYEAGLTDCHLQQLEPFQVKANLVVPVLKGDQLVGLLIAHECAHPRNWNNGDIDLFSQIAIQLGNALEKADLLQQQQIAQIKEREAKEQLQRRALELLMEVDPVSQGDLTIRAQVREDEIGTIADSYNATIESLRKLVGQVQIAAEHVSNTTSEKEISIQGLSQGASQQTQEIANALQRIEAMTSSIRSVSVNAKAAESAVKEAAETVIAGDEAMNRTVEGFITIRETVAETAKKVKRLGESSQKISKVVNLISSFADQTNLLALNASIEAAHAGEEGRGFAVVADEVRSLARQSAEATADIEALVAEIQAETNEVVAAMELGTEQVVTGTKLVDETRSSLNQISAVSNTISQLVNSIAQATIEQSKNSETVSKTMSQVAAISDQTATEVMEVSSSFKDLLSVAQELQDSVSKFKIS